jgi:hypothetical protein
MVHFHPSVVVMEGLLLAFNSLKATAALTAALSLSELQDR